MPDANEINTTEPGLSGSPKKLSWSYRPCLMATGCWLGAVVVIHLLNAWHILAHRIIDKGYWADPDNSIIFSVQGEGTIPAWFSGVMLWSAGIGAMGLAVIEYSRSRLAAMRWGLLGVVFFYLSADEVLSLHENFNTPARQVLGGPDALASPWIIFGLFFAAVVGLACIPLLLSLSRTVRTTLILAGVVYVSGAVGIEILSETVKNALNDGQGSKLYTLLFTSEEFFEMLGVVIFLHAVHLQFASIWPARHHNSLRRPG
jgi:hypothetical protein